MSGHTAGQIHHCVSWDVLPLLDDDPSGVLQCGEIIDPSTLTSSDDPKVVQLDSD